MAISWVAFAAVAGCALAFSLLDLLRKVLIARIRPIPLLFFLSLGQLPVLGLWVAYQPPPGPPPPGYWLPALGSVLLNVAANLAFLQSVRLSPLSLTIPLLSLTPVFTALVGFLVLGEVPRALQVAGILVVVAGAFLLNLDLAQGISPRKVWTAFRSEPGSLLMVATAFCWSLAMPLDKIALLAAGAPVHSVVLNAGVCGGMLLVLLARRRTAELLTFRTHLTPLTTAILASAAAIALQLVAMGLTFVSFVETIKRAAGSLLVVVLGRIVYQEGITSAKLLSVLLMSAGVALVLLG